MEDPASNDPTRLSVSMLVIMAFTIGFLLGISVNVANFVMTMVI